MKGYNHYLSLYKDTDKNAWHNYGHIYETLLCQYEQKTISFLEIGIYSGGSTKSFEDFFNFCRVAELNVVGLMCIPPINKPVEKFFSLLKNLADKYNINNLSMGMSNDYKQAMLLGSTWVRIGSKIFSN